MNYFLNTVLKIRNLYIIIFCVRLNGEGFYDFSVAINFALALYIFKSGVIE